MYKANYVEQSIFVLSGDFNSRVDESKDFIVNDDLSNTIVNNITNSVAYSNDFALPSRNSEERTCNNFVRKLPASLL